MTNQTQKQPLNKNILWLSAAIFLGLVLGATLGLVIPDWAINITSFISTIYLHALTLMIFPLIFCSLVVGITSIVSINILVDAGATCCNVLGDIACSVAMERTCHIERVHTEAAPHISEIYNS